MLYQNMNCTVYAGKMKNDNVAVAESVFFVY